MFEPISDRWKKDASGALRLGVIAAASLVTATVTLSFLCAAAFVIALQRYGLVDARLAGAGVFLMATLALVGAYTIRVARRRRDAQARRRAQLWSRRLYPSSLIRASFWSGLRLSRRSASSASRSSRSPELPLPSLPGRCRSEDAVAPGPASTNRRRHFRVPRRTSPRRNTSSGISACKPALALAGARRLYSHRCRIRRQNLSRIPSLP